MIDTLKKTLLAGFGAAVVTKETVESTLHDWIAKGKITPAEARGYAEKLVATGEAHWEKLKDDVTIKAAEILQKANVARQKEVDEIEARITALEQSVRATAAAAGIELSAAEAPAETPADAEPAATDAPPAA